MHWYVVIIYYVYSRKCVAAAFTHFTHSAGDEFTCYSVRRGRSDTVVISMSETTAELVFHWTGHGTHSQLEIKYLVLGSGLTYAVINYTVYCNRKVCPPGST